MCGMIGKNTNGVRTAKGSRDQVTWTCIYVTGIISIFPLLILDVYYSGLQDRTVHVSFKLICGGS